MNFPGRFFVIVIAVCAGFAGGFGYSHWLMSDRTLRAEGAGGYRLVVKFKIVAPPYFDGDAAAREKWLLEQDGDAALTRVIKKSAAAENPPEARHRKPPKIAPPRASDTLSGFQANVAYDLDPATGSAKLVLAGPEKDELIDTANELLDAFEEVLIENYQALVRAKVSEIEAETERLRASVESARKAYEKLTQSDPENRLADAKRELDDELARLRAYRDTAETQLAYLAVMKIPIQDIESSLSRLPK
jgi:hypothetical protein